MFQTWSTQRQKTVGLRPKILSHTYFAVQKRAQDSTGGSPYTPRHSDTSQATTIAPAACQAQMTQLGANGGIA